MAKHRYFRGGRIRTLKEGVDPKQYEHDHPDAIKISRVPSMETLEEWNNDGGCETVGCGCWVEPDGTCEHGRPSWLMAMGMI